MKFGTLLMSLFSFACIAGGITGYVRADSLPSLIVGGTSGLIMAVLIRRLSQGASTAAAISALLLSLAIAGRFLMTYLRTHDVMPHLIMLVLGLCSALAAMGLLLRSLRTADAA